ncbi:MAG: hypothetical protein CL484_04645 [Acidobacteria bacterium]|nr:hypothetical protein [Acidobacteriota bacterium]
MKQNKASQTARFVSNGIYWVSKQPCLGVEVPLELSRYTAAMTNRLEIERSLLGAGVARRLLLLKSRLMQAVSIPGIYLHQVIRKRYIESITRATLAGAVRQLVVIGAGFDTLSLRISLDMPDLRVIEIDHPATQQIKKIALEGFDLPLGTCHLVSADLSLESLASVLARSGEYDAEVPTLFVAEGLTMYLDEAQIRDLLTCIGTQASGSEFLFTYMEETEPGQYDFQNTRPVTSLWLALRSERFTWGIKKPELSGFLAESGFSLREHRTPDDLRVAFLTEANRSATVARGENIALATR